MELLRGAIIIGALQLGKSESLNRSFKSEFSSSTQANGIQRRMIIRAVCRWKALRFDSNHSNLSTFANHFESLQPFGEEENAECS